MSLIKTPAQLAATMQKEVREVQTAFSSKHFLALVEIMGETTDGHSFNYNMTFDSNDPEFREMLNAYGARKSYAILQLTTKP